VNSGQLAWPWQAPGRVVPFVTRLEALGPSLIEAPTPVSSTALPLPVAETAALRQRSCGDQAISHHRAKACCCL
jgi:hypothetical protein